MGENEEVQAYSDSDTNNNDRRRSFTGKLTLKSEINKSHETKAYNN
jgi:hypothetical protein